MAVDPESQLITAVAVLPGNAPDNQQALELIEQTEENAQVEVEETIGDCAFGDGTTRQEFATVANLTLVATKAGLMRGQGKRQYHPLAPILGALMALIATFTLSISSNPELKLETSARKVGFRPDF